MASRSTRALGTGSSRTSSESDRVNALGGTPERMLSFTAFALALVMTTFSLYESVDREQAWKPGHFLPRFVMDTAKLAGFLGIRYRSVRATQGMNLVLFGRGWPATFVGPPEKRKEEAHQFSDAIIGKDDLPL
jgi:hypothetical protein